MRVVIVLTAAVLLAGLVQVGSAGPSGKEPGQELATLEQKLLGTWEGSTPCDGSLVFREDGTYDLTGYGPAHDDSKGTWRVRRGSCPATLVLTCTTSEIQGEAGRTTEVKLIKLDDTSLAVEYANQNGNPPGDYARVK
jgi:hypothetical protein